MGQGAPAIFGRHGGRLDEARRAYPAAPAPWLDLSTGINPAAWQPREPLAVDPGPLPCLSALRGLEIAAAHYFGVPPDRVAAVPGSEIALRLLGALKLPSPIVASHPSYGTHAAVAHRSIEASELGKAAGQAGTILLANPNNPDGRLLGRSKLHAIARSQRSAGGWLVVDEAFADPLPQHSILPELAADDPVLVTRSFGKFFGLAGLRLGFVIAPAPLLGALRGLLGDWPVSAQAIAWGTAAYNDAAWIEGSRERLAVSRNDLDRTLARHGLAAAGECPLFALVEHDDAPAIFDRLAGAGILTRPFAERPRWLRFGLPGTDAALDRLDRALAHG